MAVNALRSATALSLVATVSTIACGRGHFDLMTEGTPDPGPAPLVWLKMDEPSGNVLSDSSGNGHDAACGATSCPSLGVPGVFGTAAVFDGVDDYAKIPFAPDLDVAAITVSLWASQISHSTTYSMLISRQRGTVNNDLWTLGYSLSPGYEYSWSITSSDPINVHGGPSSADLGIWKHLAGTYDGTIARLYRNGALVDAVPANGPLVSDLTGILVGAGDNGNPMIEEWTHAAIDDVRIYATALGPDDVAALYREGAP